MLTHITRHPLLISAALLLTVACADEDDHDPSLNSSFPSGASNMSADAGDGSASDSGGAPTGNYLTTDDFSLGHGGGCLVSDDNEVWCWGHNSNGVQGPDAPRFEIGNMSDPFKATRIRDIPEAQQVAVGWSSACALTTDARVFCWGTGGAVFPTVPLHEMPAFNVQTYEITGFGGVVTQLEVGVFQACALLDSGEVSCWGTHQETPARLEGFEGITQVSAGRHAVCGLDRDGAVYMVERKGFGFPWGEVEMLAPRGVSKVDCTDSGVCALFDDGHIGCMWMDPDDVEARRLATIEGISDAIDMDKGYDTSCGLLPNGTPLCWGAFNTTDHPGEPRGINTAAVPTPGLTDGQLVRASGDLETCVLTSHRTIRCNTEYQRLLGLVSR